MPLLSFLIFLKDRSQKLSFDWKTIRFGKSLEIHKPQVIWDSYLRRHVLSLRAHLIKFR